MPEEQLSDILGRRREEVEALLARFGDDQDPAPKGASVLLVVSELSGAIAQRAEAFRPTLRQLGCLDALAEFDQWRERLLDTLSRLDALSSGVGPRDVMAHQPEQVTALMCDLETELVSYLAFEDETLMPLIKARAGVEQLTEMRQRAVDAARHAPTHPHPDRSPADERHPLVRALQSGYDHLRDEMSHPRAALQGKGEEGP